MQLIELFPLWAALHTGCRPLDLEFRGFAGFCLHDDCLGVPFASMVGRRTADEVDPPTVLNSGI